MEVLDAKTRKVVPRTADGAFVVVDQREYIVHSDESLTEISGLLSLLPISSIAENRVARLCFENYVGLAQVAGERFQVKNSKLSEEAFEAMLDGVVEEVADLAFDFASPTELPFERDDLGASEEVRYHALAYLRHVMRRVAGGERLLGSFLQIARNPCRRMEAERKWIDTNWAVSVGHGGLLAIAAHPEHLIPIDPHSRLARTGLGRSLVRTHQEKQALFPTLILSSVRNESFDTHENRLVLHVLRLAGDLVAEFERKPLANPRLREDLRGMREDLDWMLQFDFLRGLGPMRIVPLQSTVLQRRDGYREFMQLYLRLALSSALSDDRDRWHALLDLKDGALLYEMWCFLTVKRVVDGVLGNPARAELVGTEHERRKVPWAARVVYKDGDELVYNRTYSQPTSFSVTLRPDIVLRTRRKGRWSSIMLDAKLKFDGERLDGLTKVDPTNWDRGATRADLYKMHTYRDAIHEAAGAFVLYPGSKLSRFVESEGAPSWTGIGAIPLVPGDVPTHLETLVTSFLKQH